MANKAKPDYMAQLTAAGERGLIVGVSNSERSIHWRAADTLPKDKVEFDVDKWGRRIVRLASVSKAVAARANLDAENAQLRARVAALEAALRGVEQNLHFIQHTSENPYVQTEVRQALGLVADALAANG